MGNVFNSLKYSFSGLRRLLLPLLLRSWLPRGRGDLPLPPPRRRRWLRSRPLKGRNFTFRKINFPNFLSRKNNVGFSKNALCL